MADPKRSASFPSRESPESTHRVLFADVTLRIRFDTENETFDLEVLDEKIAQVKESPENSE